MQTILFALLLATVFVHVSSQCVFTPILSGVTPLQPLGEGAKKQITNAADCKQLCASETAFNCTAFLWPAEGGDCYLYDHINLAGEIFRDPMDSYVLYVKVCNGTTPAVGFCEFSLSKTGITGTTTNAISPGIATEASCRQFCIARYQGPTCNAYVVSPDKNSLSRCLLYSQTPTGLSNGTVNLYVKNCHPPPQSCQYTSWSTFGSCTQNCIKTRQRQILSQPTTGGAPCLASELVDNQSCTDSPCILTTPGATTTTRPGPPGAPVIPLASSTRIEVACQQTAFPPALFHNFHSFKCEAYSTTGPGGPCVLHGAIDRVTLVTIMSTWYLQDINCVVNTSAATSLCGWQMVRNAIGPLDTTASRWKSLGYAINADHCGTLCMMNHPMYSPTACEAYAYSGAVSWLGPQNNCFMYTAIDNPWSFNSTGSYDLYKLQFHKNKAVAASGGILYQIRAKNIRN
uniref:Apple domain-containing protein n=1 Tax=Panagrolaimus sp. JU765 TaxID=591449 RepID=A0AC34QRJ2_9BILA